MNTTKAIVIEDVDTLNIEQLPMPEIGDYEVLFKSRACSLCTIDRRAYKGARKTEYPFLGGHECAGEILQVGKGVMELKVGDHAILTSTYCMQCENDRYGHMTQCSNKWDLPRRVDFKGSMVGGGLCEYLAVPAWQVIKVNKDLPFEKICLAEPLACVVHSIKKAKINLGDTVVIIGFGVMGYLHLKLALLQGARVIVSEPNEYKRNRAKSEGAALVIDPTVENLTQIVLEQTDNMGANVVVNTIPVSSAWQQAFEIMGSYSKLICYSSQDKKEGVPVDFGKIHSKEFEIIGTVSPTLEDNSIAIKLIIYNIVDMSKVVDGIYSFDDYKEAFEKACDPNGYRTVIKY